MMEKYISGLRDVVNKEYNLKDVARVADRRLQSIYVSEGIRPIDVYPSFDRDGKKICVIVFDKSSTRDIYTRWLNNEFKDKELN